MNRLSKLTLITAILTLMACRASNGEDVEPGEEMDNGSEMGGNTTPTPTLTQASIFDVQKGQVAVGASVQIDNVVVTAIDNFEAGEAGRNIFVQDPAGGAFSGLALRDTIVEGGLSNLKEGDLVTISGGKVEEFAFKSDKSGRSTTRITGAMMNVVGQGTMPEPEVLLPWDLSASDDEAEKWEGVLIQFADVGVHGGAKTIGKDEKFMEFKITGPLYLESNFTDLSTVKDGDCFASVSGVLDYAFNYKLVPRSEGDMVAGGNCLFEGGKSGDDKALCDNGLDDDYDGFSDCGDFACQSAVGDVCFPAKLVAEVQKAAHEKTLDEGDLLRFDQVTVTAVMENGTIWVQDGQDAALWNGIMVSKPQMAEGTQAPQVGDQVSLRGQLDEEYGVTRLRYASLTPLETESLAPTPLRVYAVSQFADEAMGEAYEGVLLEFGDLRVAEAPNNYGEFLLEGGLIVDDLIFVDSDKDVMVGQVFELIRGVIHYGYGSYRLLPRSADDLLTQ